MFGLGAPEIIMILVIALLVLGPKRLPDAARSLGRGLGEFRRASSELRSAITAPVEDLGREPPRPAPKSPAALATSSESAPGSGESSAEPARKPAAGAGSATSDDD